MFDISPMLSQPFRTFATAENQTITKQDIDFMKDLGTGNVFCFLPRKDEIKRAEKLKLLGLVEMNYSLTSTGARLTDSGKKAIGEV